MKNTLRKIGKIVGIVLTYTMFVFILLAISSVIMSYLKRNIKYAVCFIYISIILGTAITRILFKEKYTSVVISLFSLATLFLANKCVYLNLRTAMLIIIILLTCYITSFVSKYT